MWSSIKDFFRAYWLSIIIVGGLASMVGVGLHYQVDLKVLALITLIAGFITNGFVALATLIALVPIVGPFLVKLLSLPIFYLFNGLGYFLSLLAIKKGYGTEIVSYRVITVMFLVGVVIGYTIGNLMPLR